MEGGCTCRAVRFRLDDRPIIVHACHCRWCQRETGTAFALNAVLETGKVTILAGEPTETRIPSESGKGQRMVRCPTCGVTVWSHYPGGGDRLRFVRVGTLDDPDAFPPDAHIYVASKQPWLDLPEGAAAFPAFYDPKSFWSPEQHRRFKEA